MDDPGALVWLCSGLLLLIGDSDSECAQPVPAHTFRIFVVLCDVLTALTAHTLGADVVTSVFCATKSWLEGVICFVYPHVTLGIDGSKEVADIIINLCVPFLDGMNRGWPTEG